MVEGKKPDINSLLFTQLIMSFQVAALQHMGKAPDPVSGKSEKKMELAKNSIDILGMIEEKTSGNLTDDERKFLQQTLTQLRMIYVEETNKQSQNDRQDK